jgi:cell division protein FtsB
MTIGVLLMIYLTLDLVAGDNGLLRYLELKSIRDQLTIETVSLEQRNRDIRSQIEAFENEPERIEELAREFGMTKEGELVFRFDGSE